MVNPTESKTEQRALRRPVEHAGRLLELIGNDKPRWMVATLVFKRTKPGVSAGSFAFYEETWDSELMLTIPRV